MFIECAVHGIIFQDNNSLKMREKNEIISVKFMWLSLFSIVRLSDIRKTLFFWFFFAHLFISVEGLQRTSIYILRIVVCFHHVIQIRCRYQDTLHRLQCAFGYMKNLISEKKTSIFRSIHFHFTICCVC